MFSKINKSYSLSYDDDYLVHLVRFPRDTHTWLLIESYDRTEWRLEYYHYHGVDGGELVIEANPKTRANKPYKFAGKTLYGESFKATKMMIKSLKAKIYKNYFSYRYKDLLEKKVKTDEAIAKMQRELEEVGLEDLFPAFSRLLEKLLKSLRDDRDSPVKPGNDQQKTSFSRRRESFLRINLRENIPGFSYFGDKSWLNYFMFWNLGKKQHNCCTGFLAMLEETDIIERRTSSCSDRIIYWPLFRLNKMISYDSKEEGDEIFKAILVGVGIVGILIAIAAVISIAAAITAVILSQVPIMPVGIIIAIGMLPVVSMTISLVMIAAVFTCSYFIGAAKRNCSHPSFSHGNGNPSNRTLNQTSLDPRIRGDDGRAVTAKQQPVSCCFFNRRHALGNNKTENPVLYAAAK